MHSRALEAGTDHYFAPRLHDAAGGTQAERFEVGITHMVAITMQVLKAFSGFVAGIGVAPYGAQQVGELTGIKFVVTSPRPLMRSGRIGSIDGFGHRAESLLDMKTVHDLEGAREQCWSNLPDPGRAVADDYRAFGLRKAPA